LRASKADCPRLPASAPAAASGGDHRRSVDSSSSSSSGSDDDSDDIGDNQSGETIMRTPECPAAERGKVYPEWWFGVLEIRRNGLVHIFWPFIDDKDDQWSGQGLSVCKPAIVREFTCPDDYHPDVLDETEYNWCRQCKDKATGHRSLWLRSDLNYDQNPDVVPANPDVPVLDHTGDGASSTSSKLSSD
jgi:hypothetical protein